MWEKNVRRYSRFVKTKIKIGYLFLSFFNLKPVVFRESVLYRLSYYRFFQVKTKTNEPAGYDRVRMQKVPDRAVGKLSEFEEAYTSKNWLVRIYRIKKTNNRGFWLDSSIITSSIKYTLVNSSQTKHIYWKRNIFFQNSYKSSKSSKFNIFTCFVNKERIKKS